MIGRKFLGKKNRGPFPGSTVRAGGWGVDEGVGVHKTPVFCCAGASGSRACAAGSPLVLRWVARIRLPEARG